MAKSLFGKADPTLVNAALKEGLSNIPADMTEAFDAMTTTYKQTNQFLLDTATKMFEEVKMVKHKGCNGDQRLLNLTMV